MHQNIFLVWAKLRSPMGGGIFDVWNRNTSVAGSDHRLTDKQTTPVKLHWIMQCHVVYSLRVRVGLPVKTCVELLYGRSSAGNCSVVSALNAHSAAAGATAAVSSAVARHDDQLRVRSGQTHGQRQQNRHIDRDQTGRRCPSDATRRHHDCRQFVSYTTDVGRTADKHHINSLLHYTVERRLSWLHAPIFSFTVLMGIFSLTIKNPRSKKRSAHVATA